LDVPDGELLGEKAGGVAVLCEAGVELAGLAELVTLSDAFQYTADAVSIFFSPLASLTSPVFGLI
jgi:hypothetical protein